MIETKPYNLTKATYTSIVINKRLKKSWWAYAIILVVSLLYLKDFNTDSFARFAVIFGFIYPFGTLAYLYIWARSSKHNMLFETMNFSFDESHLYFTRNGNETKIPVSNILEVVSKQDYWLLYIQQGNFIYVKKAIFYSEDDLINFKTLMNLDE